MVFTPVGIKCAEHAGVPTGVARVAQDARRLSTQRSGTLLTKILIGVNVAVYALMLARGSALGSPSGPVYQNYALYGPLVAQGEWWRLLTAAFLHANVIHLAMNMLFLWWIGGPVEQMLGRARFALLYLVSGLAGSAGALLLDPTIPTVGASGAIFGLLGAAFVFERQRLYVLGGSAMTIIVLNLVLTFTLNGISIGGHVGGLVGGAIAGLALSRFGRGHAAYGRLGLIGIAGVVAVGIVSVALAYWKVAPYA